VRKWGTAMHGDFSRWTFAAVRDYRSVLLQQGRVLLDADWNEQTRLTAHHDEVRTLDVVGRSGGPLPEDGGAGPFAILASDGSVPSGTAWADLVVTPGRYYVDGVLAESWPRSSTGTPAGWALTDQPFLATIGSGVTADPGLPEPPTSPDGTRYALYLEVSEHQVTADEAPELRESALGGPDTTTRAQTVWQVRWQRLDGAEQCTDLHAADWLARTPRTMVAALRDAEADADPCRITTTGGYRRLENQLYRVQVHDAGDDATPTTFLWSRENGSVVAGLVALTTSALPGVDAVLQQDRVGRDDELSIRQGDLVEVTSTDRALRRLPGYLARAGVPDGIDLPVVWLAGHPTSLAALGRAPIVRRWEGGPVRASATAVDLEDGLTVRFPTGGQAATGDYWLVPARAVRLAYGVSELRGTIDWPVDGSTPRAMPPAGPPRHVAPLAILRRTGGRWTRESDCRLLFPPLTGLVSLDLVGGDGQEDLPGEWLDAAVRVVVRNGGSPVSGVPVRFTLPSGGLLADAVGAATPPVGAAGPLTLTTGTDGVAAARWQLDPGGPTTQTLQVRRLDDHGAGVDVEVVATARLSVATEVAWSHADCPGLEEVTTVAGALDRLVERPELRLVGGDGQHLVVGRHVLPQPIRLLVDNACGPMAGVPVNARATSGALVAPATSGDAAPADLTGTGADVADSTTTPDGGALFWWQPDVSTGSDTLELRLPGDDPHAPIVVTAQAAPRRRTPGVHLEKVEFGTGAEFVNDATVDPETLASGIVVSLDGALAPDAVAGSPAIRVELELPWPLGDDGAVWSERPIGTRTVTLDGAAEASGTRVHWVPSAPSSAWFRDRLWAVLDANGWKAPLLGRFLLDGWALPAIEPKGLAVNTHADAVLRGGHAVLRLPTDDDVTGGTFVQWFRLQRKLVLRPGRVLVPDLTGMTLTQARRALKAAGIVVQDTRIEAVAGIAKGRVAAAEPPAGTEVDAGSGVLLTVARG
jgi:uncharacterized protein DUF6519/PASTA domain-containing protein